MICKLKKSIKQKMARCNIISVKADGDYQLNKKMSKEAYCLIFSLTSPTQKKHWLKFVGGTL